jgi:hypothetical protein
MMRRRTKGPKGPVEWDFWSFPTYFAFFVGILIAPLLFAVLGYFAFMGALFASSFCAAHVISRWWRNRSVDKRMQRAEEDERERRALAARAANAAEGEAQSPRRRRRRR